MRYSLFETHQLWCKEANVLWLFISNKLKAKCPVVMAVIVFESMCPNMFFQNSGISTNTKVPKIVNQNNSIIISCTFEKSSHMHIVLNVCWHYSVFFLVLQMIVSIKTSMVSICIELIILYKNVLLIFVHHNFSTMITSHTKLMHDAA